MTDYRFRLTIHTDDIAALYALRGLVHYCQADGSDKMKAWGGTGEGPWEADGHKVTFKFSKQTFREKFVSEAQRLMPGRWDKVSESGG